MFCSLTFYNVSMPLLSPEHSSYAAVSGLLSNAAALAQHVSPSVLVEGNPFDDRAVRLTAQEQSVFFDSREFVTTARREGAIGRITLAKLGIARQARLDPQAPDREALERESAISAREQEFMCNTYLSHVSPDRPDQIALRYAVMRSASGVLLAHALDLAIPDEAIERSLHISEISSEDSPSIVFAEQTLSPINDEFYSIVGGFFISNNRVNQLSEAVQLLSLANPEIREQGFNELQAPYAGTDLEAQAQQVFSLLRARAQQVQRTSELSRQIEGISTPSQEDLAYYSGVLTSFFPPRATN